MKNTQQQDKNVLTLLRLCTLLLAAVSFWATANGMREYTFPEGWMPYAASLGIQGLLLGLNFSFFRFWRVCRTRSLRGVLTVLTCVVLLCSSWFSFLYISDKAYEKSWPTERRLLAQRTYRDELFKADTYLVRYGEEMGQTMTDEIADLYIRASEMDVGKVNVAENLDWDAERDRYADSEARDIMDTIINAMAQAMVEDATQDARDQSEAIVSSSREELQKTIESLTAQIDAAERRLTQADARLAAARNQLNAATDADRASLQAAVEAESDNYNRATRAKAALERQLQDYQAASNRISFYSSLLGMTNEGVSSYYVGEKLRDIQKELFSAEPDLDAMMALAADVFERLQSAVDLDASAEGVGDSQALLSDMNRFITHLENYVSIKKCGVTIQQLADKLANEQILSLSNSSSGWMKSWQNEFNELKAAISGLPVYVEAGTDTVLRSYSREDATARLDKAIRKYLTEHNTAQQGLIYLASPYRSIAIFSLILALFLDIAAFVTGFMIDKADALIPHSSPRDTSIQAKKTRSLYLSHEEHGGEEDGLDEDMSEVVAWNAMPSLNRYLFLTGNYQYLDGIRTYMAIESGEETEVECSDEGLVSGLYRWNNNSLVPLSAANLCYKGTVGGPQDGVYMNATINYEDRVLTIMQNGAGQFLGMVDPYTPVYFISDDKYDSSPAKEIQNVGGKLIVVGLNQVGTRIIAIYVVS